MGSLAETVANGCAQSFGGRQWAQDDGAALGVERAQAGVKIAGQFLRVGPASPGKDGCLQVRQALNS